MRYEIIKKKSILIAAGYIAIIVFTVAAIIIGGRTYSVYVNNPYHSKKVTVVCSDESVVESTEVRFEGDYVHFKFKSLKKGTSEVFATVYNEKTSLSTPLHITHLPCSLRACCI